MSFRFAFFPYYLFGSVDHFNDLPWSLFRLGILIISKPKLQVFGLPHIKHFLAGTNKKINTGSPGSRPKKFLTKPVLKRFSMLKETKLLFAI